MDKGAGPFSGLFCVACFFFFVLGLTHGDGVFVEFCCLLACIPLEVCVCGGGGFTRKEIVGFQGKNNNESLF